MNIDRKAAARGRKLFLKGSDDTHTAIPNALLGYPGLSVAARVLAALLLTKTDKVTGSCSMTCTELVKCMHPSERKTLPHSLDALKKAGLIDWTGDDYDLSGLFALIVGVAPKEILYPLELGDCGDERLGKNVMLLCGCENAHISEVKHVKKDDSQGRVRITFQCEGSCTEGPDGQVQESHLVLRGHKGHVYVNVEEGERVNLMEETKNE
jgi:hypothetical protein